MRLGLVLVGILAVLLAGIVKVATRQRGAPVTAPATAAAPRDDDERGARAMDEIVSAPARPRASGPRPALPVVDRRGSERASIAILHGRVRGVATDPDDDAGGPSSVEVVATDGARTVTARAKRDGRFSFHLPPGSYTLRASTGPWVAIRTDVVARGGVDREVDLELTVGATISGHLRRRADGDVDLVATSVGSGSTDAGGGEAEVDDDTFTVRGLVPGKRYDLTFTGESARTVRLRGVMAPAEGLEVAIERRATIRGAIGFALEDGCAIDEVRLVAASADRGTSFPGPGSRDRLALGRTSDSDPDADGDGSMETDHPAVPDGACTFELAVPDAITIATVVATGGGWHLEESVAIPTSGDPPALCLNPPCANPEDVTADVVVDLDGPDGVAGLVASLSSAELGSEEVCLPESNGQCVFKRRRIGSILDVRAQGQWCVSDDRRITVKRGTNVIELSCSRPLRRARGS